jgi:hypothetical protein
MPPVAQYVSAGRRALRRRRAVSGLAALATATILFTGGYAVLGDSRPGGGRFATDPSTSPTPSATPGAVEPTAGAPEESPEAPWPPGVLLRYADGHLEIRPGVVVHEHIANPYGFEPPSLSDALDVTWHHRRQWLIITQQPPPQGITSSSSTPSDGWASFADYVADQVHADATSGWPDTFVLDDQGRVVPTDGVRVFNRTDAPRLGADFAPPGATTGAAVVSVAGDPESYFVVWRVIDGGLDVITTAPDDTVGATFQELLTAARARYASGEGLR